MDELKFEQEELYHYTTLDGLKSIIENKTIRLTDYRFLNDISELKYSVQVIEEILQNYKNEIQIEAIKKCLKNILNGVSACFSVVGKDNDGKLLFTPHFRYDTKFYIFSMTDKSDDLAMWSMYGKSGCRIKLNGQKLFNFFYNKRDSILSEKGIFDFSRGKVCYGNNDTTAECKFFELLAKKGGDLYLNAQNCIERLCALRKESAYAYESEYRIGLRFYDDWIDNQRIKKVFTVKDGLIKPQLEFSDFPVEEIIEEIVISPFNKLDCSNMGIVEFLKWQIKTKTIPVRNSDIKIRF